MINYSITVRPRGGQTASAGGAGLHTLVERVTESTAAAGGTAFGSGMLANALLTEGTAFWHTEDTTRLLSLGGRCVLAPGGKALSRRGSAARLEDEGGRRGMHIRSSFIRQHASEMLRLPQVEDSADGGTKSPVTVHFAMMYRCTEAGTLTVRFEDVRTDGYTAFQPMELTDTVSPSDSYALFRCQGLWNGTGSLRVECTGSISAYMFILSQEKADTTALGLLELASLGGTLERTVALNFGTDGRVTPDSDIITREKYDALISEHSGRTALTVTDQNVDGYTRTDTEWSRTDPLPDFSRRAARLVFCTTGARSLYLPGLTEGGTGYSDRQIEQARALVGTRLLLYCNGPGTLTLSGAVMEGGTDTAPLTLAPGDMALADCTPGFDTTGTECIRWDVRRGRQRTG